MPQNKSDISFEEHQQFIYKIEAQMSALKSHLKCELSMVSSKIDSLSEFVNTKINNLNDQQKILETQGVKWQTEIFWKRNYKQKAILLRTC